MAAGASPMEVSDFIRPGPAIPSRSPTRLVKISFLLPVCPCMRPFMVTGPWKNGLSSRRLQEFLSFLILREITLPPRQFPDTSITGCNRHYSQKCRFRVESFGTHIAKVSACVQGTKWEGWRGSFRARFAARAEGSIITASGSQQIDHGGPVMSTKLNTACLALLLAMVAISHTALGDCIKVNGMTYCGPGRCVNVNGQAWCSPFKLGDAVVANGQPACGPGNCAIINGMAYCSQFNQGGIIVVNGMAYTGPGRCIRDANDTAVCSAQFGGDCTLTNGLATCQGGEQSVSAELAQGCELGQLQ